MSENYAMTQAKIGGSMIGSPIRAPSLTEMMADRKSRLENELAEVNKVLAGLEKMPEAAALLDSISRLGGLRY
jgi:hypothetical protein